MRKAATATSGTSGTTGQRAVWRNSTGCTDEPLDAAGPGRQFPKRAASPKLSFPSSKWIFLSGFPCLS